MPVDANIPLSAKRPEPLGGRLSELLDLQRKAIAIQADKTALQGAQQTQRQRSALASFDWSQLAGDDGTIDLNKVMTSGLREAAGDQFPAALQQAVQLRQSQLGAKQTLLGLTNQHRQLFSEMVGALRSDPEVVNGTPEGKAKLNDTLRQFVTMAGPDSESVVKAYAPPLLNAPTGKVAQILQNIQLAANSASQQVSAQAPEFTPTGGELKQTNPLAQQGQSPQSMPVTLGPGQQEQIVTDQAGVPMVQQRSPRGAITGMREVPGMPTYRPGEVEAERRQTGETNQQIIERNRAAAGAVADQVARIDKASELAASLSTGGGIGLAQKRANFESAVAALLPGFDTAADDATKLQLLDKYLEGVAANSAAITGAAASTDAARESISRQNASAGYTPEAIQNVLSFAKAQVQAIQAKARAQDQFLEDNGTKNAHKFEAQWRDNYDPLIFQLEAAPDARAREMLKGLSNERRQELKAKVKALREMGAIK